MSTRNLNHMLRAVYERDVQKAPEQHRQRTPACPSLPRFAAAAETGWTPQGQAHMMTCPYCQTVMAMEWRIKCPSVHLLGLYLAGKGNVQAMAYHLGWNTLIIASHG